MAEAKERLRGDDRPSFAPRHEALPKIKKPLPKKPELRLLDRKIEEQREAMKKGEDKQREQKESDDDDKDKDEDEDDESDKRKDKDDRKKDQHD